MRQYYRIIDLSDEFRRVSNNEDNTYLPIIWEYKGKTFSEEDTTALTTVGIADGFVIEFCFGLPLKGAGKSEKLFSSRTIGVQTVAKPAEQYPRYNPRHRSTTSASKNMTSYHLVTGP